MVSVSAMRPIATIFSSLTANRDKTPQLTLREPGGASLAIDRHGAATVGTTSQCCRHPIDLRRRQRAGPTEELALGSS